GDKEYVGFATLPNQLHRKSVKKGFDFTLMVAGESGLGKSTLIDSLFLTDLYKDRTLLDAQGEWGAGPRAVWGEAEPQGVLGGE
uniref:Septin-type G domain-containing protein n=1 Tax=Chelonoidis abingdonii TaxID=106734 RepID=A0A8C0G5G0_CHEAB